MVHFFLKYLLFLFFFFQNSPFFNKIFSNSNVIPSIIFFLFFIETFTNHSITFFILCSITIKRGNSKIKEPFLLLNNNTLCLIFKIIKFKKSTGFLFFFIFFKFNKTPVNIKKLQPFSPFLFKRPNIQFKIINFIISYSIFLLNAFFFLFHLEISQPIFLYFFIKKRTIFIYLSLNLILILIFFFQNFL